MSAGLYYIFCDEKYYTNESGVKRFLTGYIGTPQNSWNVIAKDIRDLVEPPDKSRLSRISNLLNKINGIAVIAFADINPKLLPPNGRDTLGEVVNIARPDHIWGNIIALGLAATAKLLALKGHDVKNIDVYYDTRSIKNSHRDELKNAILDKLSSIIKEAKSPIGYKPRFRRFNDTPKANNSERRNKFQSGTYVADRLLQYWETIISGDEKKGIYIKDLTRNIENYFKRAFPEQNRKS